ncbi:MAG TPA: spore protease YyaC [Bacillales bacterium]|nr:spore protease YyaC [Bacillales bacterium]
MNLKPKIVPAKPHKIHYRDGDAAGKLMEQIGKELPPDCKRPIVIVCIGTDRSTGDALGPIIGTKLEHQSSSAFHVYGTLDKPVHAVNLESELEQIYGCHKNPYIIGIDASLGKAANIGMITFGKGPVKPGAGVKKQLPPVGHAHVTGIVNVSGFMEYFVLQNTRLNLVMQMADTIAGGLHAACLERMPDADLFSDRKSEARPV